MNWIRDGEGGWYVEDYSCYRRAVKYGISASIIDLQ